MTVILSSATIEDFRARLDGELRAQYPEDIELTIVIDG